MLYHRGWQKKWAACCSPVDVLFNVSSDCSVELTIQPLIGYPTIPICQIIGRMFCWLFGSTVGVLAGISPAVKIGVVVET